MSEWVQGAFAFRASFVDQVIGAPSTDAVGTHFATELAHPVRAGFLFLNNNSFV